MAWIPAEGTGENPDSGEHEDFLYVGALGSVWPLPGSPYRAVARASRAQLAGVSRVIDLETLHIPHATVTDGGQELEDELEQASSRHSVETR